MNQEIIDLSSRLQQLKKEFYKSNCPECTVKQTYLRAEYHRLKTQLAQLERQSSRQESVNKISIHELSQAAAVLGLYVMV